MKNIVYIGRYNGIVGGIEFNGKSLNFGTVNGNGGAIYGNTYTVTVNGAVKRFELK